MEKTITKRPFETLNPDFLDFITLLERKSVEYLVMGGYASATTGMRYYLNCEMLLCLIESDLLQIA